MPTNRQQPNFKAVQSKKLSKGNDTRWVIVDSKTGKVLDDAQGYGYRTEQKAYAGYGHVPFGCKPQTGQTPKQSSRQKPKQAPQQEMSAYMQKTLAKDRGSKPQNQPKNPDGAKLAVLNFLRYHPEVGTHFANCVELAVREGRGHEINASYVRGMLDATGFRHPAFTPEDFLKYFC